MNDQLMKINDQLLDESRRQKVWSPLIDQVRSRLNIQLNRQLKDQLKDQLNG